MSDQPDTHQPQHFIAQTMRRDLDVGDVERIVTRFPPEPNGYLHIGHAKSICLNFGIAEYFGGQCHLRFDDTNPVKEDQLFIDTIKEDVRWLGYEWAGEVRFASNYFEQLHQWAVTLIEQGDAYVCHLSADQAREYRGTLTSPGKNSPYRTRTIDENIAEFEKMRDGTHPEGSCTLRAKIDMSHPNMNLRDPILYRIMHKPHHQTGNTWKIYPTYDFAHGQEDAIEGITHSLCSLEFADHRPLYEWFLSKLPVPSAPKQYEFGRLNLSYTVTSKRLLKQLIDHEAVSGWDDPRMPTIAGMRRRGYSPASLRKFCEMTGVTKADQRVDVAMLEHAIRQDLDKQAPRAMCVLNPIKVTLTNYPADQVETLTAPGHPSSGQEGFESFSERTLSFSGQLLIDADDFRVSANKKYKRLVIGKRVRLRNAYIIEAYNHVEDEDGHVIEVLARVIEGTLGQDPADGIKAKGVIHWVDANNHQPCTVRVFDRLFNEESPGAQGGNLLTDINPESLIIKTGCALEPNLEPPVGLAYQFEREGYFCLDRESTPDEWIFNRTISLRDTWAKINDSAS